MGNPVFANMMEIASVASNGKCVAALPDVCWTPPQAPPTPNGVPIPYPNTGMASDLTDGSETVTIGGQPIALKDKSSIKKTSGDEAGSAPMKGFVTSSKGGAVFFAAWSMDVKVEGENVVRNMDIGTHNHASAPGNSPPWPFLAKVGGPTPPGKAPGPCAKEAAARQEACKGRATKARRCASKKCRDAMKCELQPYKKGKEKGCCPGQTPHHLIEVHCFTKAGGRAGAKRIKGFSKYDDKEAPCVCCDTSSRFKGDHGSMHAIQGVYERKCMDAAGDRSQMGGLNDRWTYGRAKKGSTLAHQNTFTESECSKKCIEAQLDAYHSGIGIKDDDTPLRADWTGLTEDQLEEGEAVVPKIRFPSQPKG